MLQTTAPRSPFARRLFRSSLLLAGIAALLAPAARAEKIIVGQPGITTIQQAVDQALANGDAEDLVVVPLGTYDETVVIDLTGTHQLTIRGKGNGGATTIRGASGPALRVTDAEAIVVEDLTVQSSGAGDDVAAVEIDGVAKDIVLRRVDGVAADDVGVHTGPDTLGVLIDRSEFSGLEQGFRIEGRAHRLERCVADDATSNGFVLLSTSSNCRLVRCRAAQTGFDATVTGVFDVSGSNHLLSRCTARGGLDGFAVRALPAQGQGHRLEDCTAEEATQNGFVLAGRATVEDALATGCVVGLAGGVPGAAVEGGRFERSATYGAHVTGNNVRVVDATFQRNGFDGLLVDAATGTHVRGCSFKKNDGQGVLVSGGTLTWLEDNVAKGDDGFVDQGANNGGRNNKTKKSATNDF